MSSPPRLLLPDYPVLITTRMESGLPFVARPLIKLLIQSALARAQNLYEVTICHFVIMGNHIHILVRVRCPDSVAGFMDSFKTETAHAINRLLGRRKHTVWEDGYDAIPILTVDDVVRKIVYIYTNPQAANLESTIDRYPSVSSWEMYQLGKHSMEVPWIRRSAVENLQDLGSPEEENRLYRKLLNGAKLKNTFEIEPDAWMSLFDIEPGARALEINQAILAEIRAKEAELEAVRVKEGRTVLGQEKLKAQRIDQLYTPSKFSKRMWCICSDIRMRIEFITLVKELISRAREVYNNWKLGDFSLPFPLGMFPPRFPRLANVLPGAIFDL